MSRDVDLPFRGRGLLLTGQLRSGPSGGGAGERVGRVPRTLRSAKTSIRIPDVGPTTVHLGSPSVPPDATGPLGARLVCRTHLRRPRSQSDPPPTPLVRVSPAAPTWSVPVTSCLPSRPWRVGFWCTRGLGPSPPSAKCHSFGSQGTVIRYSILGVCRVAMVREPKIVGGVVEGWSSRPPGGPSTDRGEGSPGRGFDSDKNR